MLQRVLALIAVLSIMVVVNTARAADFVVRPGGDSKVVFTSKAPTETFEGKTSLMTGTLSLDPVAVGDSITVHLEVDLASLDTGSKLRNKHMRENHLETGKFPKAVFDGAAILAGAGAKLEPGKAAAFQVEGTFTIHGVSRRLRCDAQAMVAGKGNAVAFSATFPIKLSDYDIKLPEFLFMKLAETQQVRVSATASSQP